MKTYSIVSRGKKYWVQELAPGANPRIIVGFTTEQAAARCIQDLEQHKEADERE